ncbi:MAG TPA: glycosyltransferase family 4 protein [Luteimonas sp.]|nr:glycosyltransferase family 4 protein [Luteimonas sp.]
MAGEAGLPGWIGLHFALALTGTWLARRYALHRRLLDQPGDRRSHAVATPRGGGVAIVIALLVGIGWLIFIERSARTPVPTPLLEAAAIGLALVAGIGWIDDHRPLSPWLRLAVHVLAAMILALGSHAETGNTVLALAAFGLALVLVNVWNFMDGIDGLAASQAALAAIGYALFAGLDTSAWLAVALAAACAGFLPFNLPPARIFLGDVGSGALGFALATVVVGLAGHAGSASFVLLLPLSAFLIDATLTLTARMFRGERWWQPHVQHAYQRWAQRTGRHGVATAAYAGWTLAAVAIMLLVKTAGIASMVAIVVWYVAGSIAWLRLRQDRRIAGSDRE